MQKKVKNIIRVPVDGMLIAIYIVLSLSFMTLNVGGLKITFEHFPVVLCAILYGPIDAMMVGALGELFNQLTTFGLTPTTALWVLPIVVRGLFVGLYQKSLKKQMVSQASLKAKTPIIFMIVCIVSGILSSCINTFALYVDSKMFGYYKYQMVFGVFGVRIGLSVVTSIIICLVITPVIYALRKARLA